jgi:hypothetical protein
MKKFTKINKKIFGITKICPYICKQKNINSKIFINIKIKNKKGKEKNYGTKKKVFGINRN